MNHNPSAIIAVFAGLVACAGPLAPPEPVTFGAPSPVNVPADVSEDRAPAASGASLSTVVPEADSSTLSLSIEEAVVVALSNNIDLQVQQYAPEIAGAFEQIALGDFDPELFAEGSASFDRASQTARATGERFDVEGNVSDVRVGIRQQLSTGTTYEATVEHRLDDSDRTPVQQVARVGLTLTQSLLRGFGPAVNLVGVRQAKLDVAASIYQLRGFTEALVADVENAYWQFVLANEEIRIFDNALAVAQQETAQVTTRIEVGQLPELEVAAAKVEEARRRQDLIDAQARLRAAQIRLNGVFGSTVDRPLRATSDPRDTVAPAARATESIRLATRYRPDLAEARLRLKQNRLSVTFSKNGLLPQLDLFVALRKTGFDASFSGAIENIGARNTFDVLAGLTLSQFLLNRAEDARYRSAEAGRQRAAEAIRNFELLIRLDVLLALNEIDRARDQIRASTETRVLQERAFAAEKQRFEVGAGTALLVAQAQRDLLESQIAEVRAIIDYRRALVDLYRAEGTLLARRGVKIHGT